MENGASIDWRNTDALDDDLDTFDLPPVDHLFDENDLNDRTHRSQASVTLSLQVDTDIVKWFRAQGAGWEKRMAAALRLYKEAHEDEAR